MPTTPLSRRQWFRFGLPTLFILLAVFALWLVRDVNIVHERLRERQRLFDRGGRENYCTQWRWPIRRMLGDKPSASIFPPSDITNDEWIRLQTLFPEAYIFHPMQGGIEPYDPRFDALHPETIGQNPSGPRRLPRAPLP
jgi:hypothetical protein